MTTNTLLMENDKIYTLSNPKQLPGDSDVNVSDTTTSRISISNSRIIYTSQIDTWISRTQKTKTTLKWIYDGNFSIIGK